MMYNPSSSFQPLPSSSLPSDDSMVVVVEQQTGNNLLYNSNSAYPPSCDEDWLKSNNAFSSPFPNFIDRPGTDDNNFVSFSSSTSSRPNVCFDNNGGFDNNVNYSGVGCDGGDFQSFVGKNHQKTIFDVVTESTNFSTLRDFDESSLGNLNSFFNLRIGKRKFTDVFENESQIDMTPMKHRKLENSKPDLGKGEFKLHWLKGILQIQTFDEFIDVKIICKEAFGWMIQLLNDSESDPNTFKKGVKYWAKWSGLVDQSKNHLPVLYPIHPC